MTRQIQGDDAEVLADVRVAELVAPLAPVRARRVQAHQGNALSRLLVVDAVVFARVVDVNVAADDRFDPRHGEPPQ